MTQADLDRYNRMKSTPNKSVAAEQWVLGFQAGWQAAAERWLRTPQFNDVDRVDCTTGWLSDEDAA